VVVLDRSDDPAALGLLERIRWFRSERSLRVGDAPAQSVGLDVSRGLFPRVALGTVGGRLTKRGHEMVRRRIAVAGHACACGLIELAGMVAPPRDRLADLGVGR
jgi:hypothetical protein